MTAGVEESKILPFFTPRAFQATNPVDDLSTPEQVLAWQLHRAKAYLPVPRQAVNDPALVADREVIMTKSNALDPEALVSETDAAEFLGCTKFCLRQWRTKRINVPFCRVGKLVRYRVSDLNAFLAANRIEVRA